MKLTLTLAAAMTLGAAAAHAEGDPEAGKNTFRQCSACHVIANGDDVIDGRGRTGPNLYGLAGRQAGSLEDYDYGDSIKAAGEAGLVWDEESFLAYVQDPASFLQTYLDDRRARSKMSFRLRNGGEDVWAYLVNVGPAPEAEGEAAEEVPAN